MKNEEIETRFDVHDTFYSVFTVRPLGEGRQGLDEFDGDVKDGFQVFVHNFLNDHEADLEQVGLVVLDGQIDYTQNNFPTGFQVVEGLIREHVDAGDDEFLELNVVDFHVDVDLFEGREEVLLEGEVLEFFLLQELERQLL